MQSAYKVLKEVSLNKIPLFMLSMCMTALLMWGCTSGDQDPTATPKVIEVEKIVEVDKSPGKLVVYSGRKESLVGPIIEQFSEATGIEVQVKYGSSAPMAALLMEEGDKTPADVFYAQDPGAIGSIENMLKPISADVLLIHPLQ